VPLLSLSPRSELLEGSPDPERGREHQRGGLHRGPTAACTLSPPSGPTCFSSEGVVLWEYRRPVSLPQPGPPLRGLRLPGQPSGARWRWC